MLYFEPSCNGGTNGGQAVIVVAWRGTASLDVGNSLDKGLKAAYTSWKVESPLCSNAVATMARRYPPLIAVASLAAKLAS